MSDGKKREDGQYVLLAERILHEFTGMDFDAFRAHVRGLRDSAPPRLERLVLAAYTKVREAEQRVREMSAQADGTLAGYRESIATSNRIYATHNLQSAMTQLSVASEQLDAKIEMFKLILDAYMADTETKEN